jgi:hypothetical protein
VVRFPRQRADSSHKARLRNQDRPKVGFWEIEYSRDEIWKHFSGVFIQVLAKCSKSFRLRRVHVKKFMRS